MNKLVWSAHTALFVALAFVLGWGQRMAVVLDEDISLAKSVGSEEVVAKVAKGMRLPVTGCVDTKSDITPEVRTANGVTGYLVYGLFKLERRGVLEFSADSPINFSCPGGERVVLTP